MVSYPPPTSVDRQDTDVHVSTRTYIDPVISKGLLYTDMRMPIKKHRCLVSLVEASSRVATREAEFFFSLSSSATSKCITHLVPTRAS